MKEVFKELIAVKAEIKALSESIKNIGYTMVSDTAIDHHEALDRSILITGLARDEKKLERLAIKLRRRQEDLQDILIEVEEHLDNVSNYETRAILRMVYINGLTQDEAGFELGITRRTVSRRLQVFWKNCNRGLDN